MVILLLTGIKEELSPFLDRHPFEFERDIRVYHSKEIPGLYATTTGPGLKQAGRIKKVLETILPDIIVNAGLVGILDERDEIQTGDRLKLGQVIRLESETIYPGGPGRDRLVTVDRPVHDLLDRMELHDRFRARACDMEAARLIALVGSVQPLQNKSYIHFIKIAGDRPEHGPLYEFEYMLWDWPRKSLFGKIRTLLRFPGGPAGFFRLRKLKRRATNRLTAEIEASILKILKHGGIPDRMGSVFIPH